MFSWFKKKKSQEERIKDAILSEIYLDPSQKARLVLPILLSEASDLIVPSAALPEEMCHGELAELRPKDDGYELLIDCRILERIDKRDSQVDGVKDMILGFAACYAVCDMLGKHMAVDRLRIPIGIGLPIPVKNHSHSVVKICHKVFS